MLSTELLINYSGYVCFKVGEAVFHIFINSLALNVRSVKLDFKVCIKYMEA